MIRLPLVSTLFPYTTLFRSAKMGAYADALALDQRVRSPRARALGWSPTLHSVSGNVARLLEEFRTRREAADRKSTRLNSSHVEISYAVFCLKKKKERGYMNI